MAGESSISWPGSCKGKLGEAFCKPGRCAGESLVACFQGPTPHHGPEQHCTLAPGLTGCTLCWSELHPHFKGQDRHSGGGFCCIDAQTNAHLTRRDSVPGLENSTALSPARPRTAWLFIPASQHCSGSAWHRTRSRARAERRLASPQDPHGWTLSLTDPLYGISHKTRAFSRAAWRMI